MTDMDRDEFVAQRSRRGMTDLVERLRMTANCGIPDFTNSKLLDEAANEIERWRELLRLTIEHNNKTNTEKNDEIERLRAVIVRAKDALLDGQSTQWVHDLLVDALHD